MNLRIQKIEETSEPNMVEVTFKAYLSEHKKQQMMGRALNGNVLVDYKRE